MLFAVGSTAINAHTETQKLGQTAVANLAKTVNQVTRFQLCF